MQAVKRMKIAKIIGTHSGSFHSDEALAIYMLKQLDDYTDAEIKRTRDAKVLDGCDIIVDVGGVYDHESKKYDHHQRGFTETFSADFETKLSSAGLIYKHYGKQVIKTLLQKEQKPEIADPEIDLIYNKVYSSLIEGFDGVDNGVSLYPSSIEVEPRYSIHHSTVHHMVSRLNPSWNDTPSETSTENLENFKKAMELVGGVFKQEVEYYGRSWLPAREMVKNAYENRFKYHSSGEIMVLDTGFCPWGEHLYDIESLSGSDKQVIYILFKDSLASTPSYRVRAVGKSSSSFESRKALPEAWRGVRDEELSNLSGIPGCIFVHATGFIGGNATLEGALEMARKSLEM
ncbi:UPF0160 protein [Zancudomyces culisetae]|uniref:UPF0160 protein n=1 Tax=Zancudomyces culisetae TaxID=1213189 RepID=A0A1R1PG50_ZANCU|nr:UPF0160 protein [Zancudomyces culisetae]|eukprot:OMH79965.1 UPF0160 protein [Zancudomyces culisetae]